jgi:hypothetical protein
MDDSILELKLTMERIPNFKASLNYRTTKYGT